MALLWPGARPPIRKSECRQVMTPWNSSWYGSHAVARIRVSSAEKQPIRPLDGTNSLRGRGFTSDRATWDGHHTCPGVYRARVPQGRVGIRVSFPSMNTKHLGRYASEFRAELVPVKAST